MVSLEKDNAFQLREYLHKKVVDSASSDPFKSYFLFFLGLTQTSPTRFDYSSLSLYQQCAIAGLNLLGNAVSKKDISRLLGQASTIDSTPRPWVSDVFGVMALKWIIEKMDDGYITNQFKSWIAGFLTQQIYDKIP